MFLRRQFSDIRSSAASRTSTTHAACEGATAVLFSFSDMSVSNTALLAATLARELQRQLHCATCVRTLASS
jgi:hypothetical protein